MLSEELELATPTQASVVRPISETMQIVVSCDDNYLQHLSVLILSLFETCTPEKLHIHFLVPGDFKGRAIMAAVMGEHADRLSFHVVDHTAMSEFAAYMGTTTTYNRLLMAECLPAELDRVIYLDVDMLVRANLVDLWNLDLGGNVLAAAADPAFRKWDVLGLPVGTPYFNAGVMVIDLRRWRAMALGAAAMRFIEAHPERVSYADQCALNWLLQGQWLKLDPEWNLQSFYLCRYVEGEVAYFRPTPPLAARACIVHFNAPGRPWLYMHNHPFKAEYQRYLARTPWRGVAPPDRYLGNRIAKALRDHAPILLPLYVMLRRRSAQPA